jgi:hypothetical protein
MLILDRFAISKVRQHFLSYGTSNSGEIFTGVLYFAFGVSVHDLKLTKIEWTPTTLGVVGTLEGRSASIRTVAIRQCRISF